MLNSQCKNNDKKMQLAGREPILYCKEIMDL